MGGRTSDAPVLCIVMETVGSMAAWHPGFAAPWSSLFLLGTLHLKTFSKLLHLVSKEVVEMHVCDVDCWYH